MAPSQRFAPRSLFSTMLHCGLLAAGSVPPKAAVGAQGTGAPPAKATPGRFVIGLEYASASEFSEGLARIMTFGPNQKCGFIDRAGKVVITPQFDDAFAFSEGLAAVRVGDRETGKWGFIAR